MVIQGEAKEKVYSIIADSIDVLRLYQAAVRQVEAQSDEIAMLKDRCDVLERSFGDTAALEHTVAELQERNDRLRRELEHKLSGDTSLDPDKVLDWKALAQTRRLSLIKAQNELEKCKAAVRVICNTVKTECAQERCDGMWAACIEAMKEEGYDIETEEHRIEGFGSTGCEDNTEGADEYDFL